MSNWFPFTFTLMPWWSIAALWGAMALPILWLGMRSFPGIDPWRKWTSIGLRLDLALLLIFLIGGLSGVRRSDDLTVIIATDESGSTLPASIDGAEPRAAIDRFVNHEMRDKRPGDRLGWIRFSSDAWIESLPAANPLRGAAAVAPSPDGTDIAQAIRLSLAMLPTDTMGRILLLWDGHATRGDLDAALAQAAAQRTPIDVLPLEYHITDEVSVERVQTPTSRSERDPFTVEVVLRNHGATLVHGDLRLLHQGIAIDAADPSAQGPRTARRVTLEPGLNVVRFPMPPQPSGVHQFKAMFEPDSGDTRFTNNTSEGVTLVHGRSRILHVTRADPGVSGALTAALRGGGAIEVVTIGPGDFPDDILELQQYAAVVLDDIPRGPGGLNARQDKMLARLVHDHGQSLIMIGGPESLGAGGWIASDVEDILPVTLNIPGKKVLPAGALILVIDHSGSMSGQMPGSNLNKQDIANQSAVLALETLSRLDLVGVIAFDSFPDWIAPLAVNTHPEATRARILAIGPAGGTSIAPALEEALRAMQRLDGSDIAVKHVLLMTDGQSGDGDYENIIRQMRERRITLSTIGVGADADDKLLASLAAWGGGRFHAVNDSAKLRQVFIREARVIRESLIREGTIPVTILSPGGHLPAGAAFPPLSGLVRTTPRPDPHSTVVLGSGPGDPVFAVRHAGLGKSAVFTSDARSRWAEGWIASGAFDAFWSHVIRDLARSAARDVEVSIVSASPGEARLIVERFPLERSAPPASVMHATIIDPDPSQPARSIRLEQQAPDRFEASFSTPRPGAYLAYVQSIDAHGQSAVTPAAFIAPRSPEMQALRTDHSILQQVALRTGGRMLSSLETPVHLFSRDNLQPVMATRPLRGELIVAIIVTLLLDVAVRRIAWSRQDLHRALSAAGAWLRPGARDGGKAAAKTLDTLRRARAETTSPTTSEANFEATKVPSSPTPPSREAIGPIFENKPIPKGDPTHSPDRQAPPEDTSSREETLSRLLASRRKRSDR